MKKKLTLFILTFTLASSLLYSQDFEKGIHSDEFIKNCITEIFQDKTTDLVYNNNSYRYTLLTNFLKKQVVVEYRPEYQGKNFKSTKSLPLNNKYNASIQRDYSYQKGSFNPLKYAISMTPNKKIIYRIADSDYIMIVYPIN